MNKKPIPKYRLNYLMKRIEEEAAKKKIDIFNTVSNKVQKQIEFTRRASGINLNAGQMLVKIMNICLIHDVILAQNRLKRTNKKCIRDRTYPYPEDAQPSASEMLDDLSGEKARITKADKATQKIQNKGVKEQVKRKAAVDDFVQNVKDEYYLGHGVDLATVLEKFKTRKF